MKFVEEYFNHVQELGLYPDKYLVKNKNGIEWEITEENLNKPFHVLNFCSNDILGLAQISEVKEAAIQAIHQYGSSNSSCTLYCGRIKLHHQLEQEISQFKNIPHTHLFLNAWMALQGFTDTFCHLSMKIPSYDPDLKTLIMVDENNHSCIMAAANNAKRGISGQLLARNKNEVEVKPYRYCDAENLASRLKRFIKPNWQIIVITDSVFSMTGDITPLPDLIEVMSDYEGALLVCDEAHASGAIGLHGGGIYDHFGIDPKTVLNRGIHPILLTTFSKFGGSVGASISSFSKSFTDLLDAARTSSGTASLSAPLAAAALASIKHLRQNPNLVKQLHENTKYIRSELQKYGFNVLGDTHIIAVEIDQFPKEFARILLHKYGVWVTAVWYVAKPRLRIMANATFTYEQMNYLINSIVAVRDEMR